MFWSNEAAYAEAKRPDLSLADQVTTRLTSVMQALGQAPYLAQALRTTELLIGGWAARPTGAGPAWPSDITDDHSPFEFSLAFSGHTPTLRILTEPQDAAKPSLLASWQTAEGIHEVIAAHAGASLSNHDKIAELFAPTPTTPTTHARFCIWHSAVLDARGTPRFKVYLNPAIHGQRNASALLLDALERFGLRRTWTAFARRTLRDDDIDVPVYLSLDLLGSPEARVKIYIAHSFTTAYELASRLAQSTSFQANDVQRFCHELLSSAGPFTERPPISCFAFKPGMDELHAVTLHLPVRSYLPDDFMIARRALRMLGPGDRAHYRKALDALARRPLHRGRGLQTYVSVRPAPGQYAMTVYLAPEVYSPQPITDQRRSL